MKNIDTQKTLKEIKASSFCASSGIPLEFSCGLPVLKFRNSQLCMDIPFLRYKITGEVDKTLVFPIKYVITVSLPERNIIAFEDFTYDEAFKNIDFSKPIGFFRHDAIKSFNKKEYKEKRTELFKMYDKAISSILSGSPFSAEEDKEFKDLLNIMIEPSLKPIYKHISESFYNKYLD